MKILISNQKLVEYSGSEFLTLELANEFMNRGYEITLATFKIGYPILNHLDLKKIKIINLSALEEISNLEEEYDIFWCHHTPTLYTIIYNSKIKFKKLVFQSLSSFMELETLPLFYRDISLILSNSLETKKQLIMDSQDNELNKKIMILENSVPEEYFSKNQKSYNLEKIAIVSNHIPKEIYELSEILRNNNLKVDYIGRNNNVKFVNKSLLTQYSLIITIGKTVQYSFASKVPVYCYDYFGGPGYITKENIKKAQELNFSGRGFFQKNTDELYIDILDNYNKNLKNI